MLYSQAKGQTMASKNRTAVKAITILMFASPVLGTGVLSACSQDFRDLMGSVYEYSMRNRLSLGRSRPSTPYSGGETPVSPSRNATTGIRSNLAYRNLHFPEATSTPQSNTTNSMETANTDTSAPQANDQRIAADNIRWIKVVGKFLLAAVILGSILLTAKKLISTYEIMGSISSTTFTAATVLAIAYRVVNPLGWTLTLSSLGYETGKVRSIQIWLLAESRRWLPGGVWGYASRAIQAEKIGVPVSVASASMLVEFLITVTAAVVVSLVGLFFYYHQLSSTLSQLIADRTGGKLWILLTWAVLITGACGALGLVARRKMVAKIRGFFERFSALREIRFSWPKLFAALGYMVLMAGLNGCVNLTLLPIVDAGYSVPFIVMIAATATAWIIGFLAFFSPGGILIREAALAALLLPWLPYEAGITLAVLSRIAQLLAEVTCMIPVLLCDRREPQLAS